jgi:hypothetical protein
MGYPGTNRNVCGPQNLILRLGRLNCTHTVSPIRGGLNVGSRPQSMNVARKPGSSSLPLTSTTKTRTPDSRSHASTITAVLFRIRGNNPSRRRNDRLIDPPPSSYRRRCMRRLAIVVATRDRGMGAKDSCLRVGPGLRETGPPYRRANEARWHGTEARSKPRRNGEAPASLITEHDIGLLRWLRPPSERKESTNLFVEKGQRL